ncbi:MAG: tetratricopeptide repeat protein, partial [Candidatus Acidiferrales bacterium]
MSVPIGWLLFACFCMPLSSNAQSLQSPETVSIRELCIPSKARHAYEQGIELLGKKDPPGSLPKFQRAIAKFPDYYEAYYRMAVAYLQLWRIADAERAYRTSIELSGERYAPPLLALGAILDDQKKFAEAEEVTRKGLNLDPAAWTGHYY